MFKQFSAVFKFNCLLTKKNSARTLLDIPTLGMKYSHVGNKTFPHWE